MRLEILCLCFLILITVETSSAQEFDEKIPLLDEPIITPKEEILTGPEPAKLSEIPDENKIISATSPGTTTIELPVEEAKTDTIPLVTPPIKEEPEMVEEPKKGITTIPESGHLTEEYTKGTEITPLGTLTPESLVGTITIGTSTAEVGTATLVEKGEEGTETAPLGALTPESLVGTMTIGTSTAEVGTTTLVEKGEEGTETAPLGTLTPESLVGTMTIGTTTVEVGTITLLNTGLILVPTAYRLDDKLGFNTDFIIAYYIGELWHKIDKSEFFEPIKFLFLSGDFKFSILKEKKQSPHLGAGYEWFLVLQGAAATPAQMGGEFSGKSKRFGYPYIILSKKFKYLNGHLGMMSGELGKLINPLSEFASLNSQKAIIFGLETKLFNRKINLEGIYPRGDDVHLLINTSIERFLGFDLSFMKVPHGLSIIGYFGVRLSIFPHIKDKK